MVFLLLCIVVNGLIGVIFKLFSRYEVNVLPAIIINYLACVISGILFLKDPYFILNIFEEKWLFIAMGLGLMFIIIFNAYAKAIDQSGISLATIFQKMSLIAPVTVALLFYNDSITNYKIIGLCLSVLALFLLSLSKKSKHGNVSKGIKMLLLVFFGSCIIDLTFYLVEVEQLAPGADVRFISSLFFFAMVFGAIYHFIIRRNSIKKFNQKSIIAGFALGIPNFFSIYLLLKVIAMGWEGSVVFPAVNVGVLSFAAIFGVFVFKEEVTRKKVLGFISAVASIVLLSINSN